MVIDVHRIEATRNARVGHEGARYIDVSTVHECGQGEESVASPHIATVIQSNTDLNMKLVLTLSLGKVTGMFLNMAG